MKKIIEKILLKFGYVLIKKTYFDSNFRSVGFHDPIIAVNCNFYECRLTKPIYVSHCYVANCITENIIIKK